jgi:hypothetical protein
MRKTNLSKVIEIQTKKLGILVEGTDGRTYQLHVKDQEGASAILGVLGDVFKLDIIREPLGIKLPRLPKKSK